MQATVEMPKISTARRRVPPTTLRFARQHRGLTQDQLAQLLDVRMATISERENNDVGVSWEIWVAWSTVLGLPLDWQPDLSTNRDGTAGEGGPERDS